SVSITDTVPLTVLAMYAHGLLVSVATERGSLPTATSCSLVSSLSSPIWKNDTVSVSVLTATSLRPSAVISIGLDLSARVGWHCERTLQCAPAWQPAALPSHASPLPVSMTPSPHTEVAALKCAGAFPFVRSVPVSTEQSSVMSAFTLTFAFTPAHLPFGKTTTTAVPFFWRRSLAWRGWQSEPIEMFRFSRTTISPPGPISGVPETAKRPAVQRRGLGAAFAVGTSAATNVAASANSRTFEPLDMTVSWRRAARCGCDRRLLHRSNGQGPPTIGRGRTPTSLPYPKRSDNPGMMFREHRAPLQPPYVRGSAPDASGSPSPRRQ